jgi:protein-glutamine gamma-glutamyltransferase
MPITRAKLFTRATEIVKHELGDNVQVVDNLKAGVVGMLDGKDHVVRKDPRTGATRKSVMGVKRADDVAFRLKVIDAARALATSGAEFSPGSDTDAVNPALWSLSYGGKMTVRKFPKDGSAGSPARALRDIFDNGQMYGFECATAMMVIYHKAILDTVGEEAFDAMFSEPRSLAFFRWSIKDADYVAAERMTDGEPGWMPGTHYYYRNPDASDENSAFRGENVIYLGSEKGERMFYAHGVVGKEGTYLVSEKDLVRSLRMLRKRGAKTEPFREKFSYRIDAPTIEKRAHAALAQKRSRRASA